MAFEALTGVNGDLVTISWMASKGANQTEHYLKEEVGGTVFFAFRASFSSEDLFATENTSPFGEIKMKRNQFPCMRSIGNDVDTTVNEAFLKSLEVLIGPRTSFHASVSKQKLLKCVLNRKHQNNLCLKLTFFRCKARLIENNRLCSQDILSEAQLQF